MQSENKYTKVLNYRAAPWVTLGGGAATEGKKRQLLTVSLPSQTGDVTARTAPPRMENYVGIAPPRLQMDLIRLNAKASVTGPPA